MPPSLNSSPKKSPDSQVFTAGVVADTHNLLRPEVLKYLAGSEIILHAGDIGGEEILAGLQTVAPVAAVRGNIDSSSIPCLPDNRVVEFHGFLVYLLHDLEDLDLDPAEAGFKAVVSGHSHRPTISAEGGVLFVNPGSAGPRRFNLPVSLARLHAYGGLLTAELIHLE